MAILNQLQHLSDRFKNYGNERELKEDLLQILTQLKEHEIIEEAKPTAIGDIVQERLKQLTDVQHSAYAFMPSGFKAFDAAFGGFLPGELVVIGARPAMGKTQLITQLCIGMAAQGFGCALLSLEQNPFHLANRFIANITGISQQRLIKAELSTDDQRAVKECHAYLKTLPILIYDQYISSLYSIIEHSKLLVEKHQCKVIVIDYVQLISNNHRKFNRETEMAYISREIKRLAKTLNVCVVLVSQLSRAVESRPGGSKRPQLSDLRESGAIEQEADKVLLMYRAEYYGLEVDENNESTKGVVELMMAKNKSGGLESIKLFVDENFCRFSEYKEKTVQIDISDERMKDLL